MNTGNFRCWAEISLLAICHNYDLIRAQIPEHSKIMVVLKANAYGHGARTVAKAIQKHAPTAYFGVASIEEAVELRRSGIKNEILILGYANPQLANNMSKENITQTILSEEYCKELSARAKEQTVTVKTHIKVDTGMSRLGIRCSDEEIRRTADRIEGLLRLENLEFRGIFTHLSSLYEQDLKSKEYSQKQIDLFQALCDTIASDGYELGLRHCNNSAGCLNHPEYAMDMCRAGTVLYGILPMTVSKVCKKLMPALTFKSRIVAIRSLPPGASVSYGRTATTTTRMDLAVLSVGYGDGYPRSLSNRGKVLIRGFYCDIVGTICMDMVMVDVSRVSGVRVGDEAVLIGTQGGQHISCEDITRWIDTCPSEITSQITNRVKRIYQ